ncbi:MAG: hypothetical protein E4H20_10440 [Spirochaetales bacterium]|nr:MAG: hypothetical protein E4H20_10440 [Spirochaetales bacterium]
MHDRSAASSDSVERIGEKLDPSLSETIVEGKRVKRRDLLNLCNYINFREGTVLVCFRHREQGNCLFFQAHPSPCLDETLVCSWMPLDLPLNRLKLYDCESLLLSDGYNYVTIKAEVRGIDSKEVSFLIPQSGYEKSIRTMDRHACKDIAAHIIQAGMGFEGSLDDFNTMSFKVEIEGRPSDSLRWINPEQPVMVLLSRDGALLYS